MSTGGQASRSLGLRGLVVLGVFALALAGCTESGERATPGASATQAPEAPPAAAEAPDSTAAPAPGGTQKLAAHLQPDDVRRLLGEHADILLLDVRQPEEWNESLGHIEGAKLIPLPDLPARLAELEDWRNRPIVTVCRSGRRSEIARKALVEAGFTNVANMDGGMIEWRRTE